MLDQLRGFLSYFQGAVNIFAINYMQCKEEEKQDGEDAFSMEEAVQSTLSLFRLSNENIDFLTTQIMMRTYRTKDDEQKEAFDLSFYAKGFRYYEFENDTRHDMQSQMMMYSFKTTPEKILLKLCEKAKVIGISATATLPSVVGNYDLDYLKAKLQKNYIEMTDQEKKRLVENFEAQQAGYKNINICAELLGENEEYSVQSWMGVFDNQELAQHIFNQIQVLFSKDEDKKDYFKKRYLRVALAFKQFIIHEDIYSFLCVLNKHPKPDDKELDKEVLLEIFRLIAQENKWHKYDKEKNIVFLNGTEYDDKKNNLIERLEKGEKIFVISVYQTIGIGQNLQYRVPTFLQDKIVKINNRESDNKKDFDAIYLDKPTNLIVALNNKMKEDSFVKYLFQMEYLQEASELSPSETIQKITNAFKIFMAGEKYNSRIKGVSYKKSVMLMYTRLIIQAIGRICRTNQKNKNIYIYADHSIADILDVSIVNGRTFNKEFIALVNRVKQTGEKAPETILLEDKASLISIRANKMIHNMLNYTWNEMTIKQWRALRIVCLKYPSASEDVAKTNPVIKNTYIRFPSKRNYYYYYQKEDFNEVSISFVKDKKHSMLVSEAGTRLQELLKIPGVREHFEENGYATSIENNHYMMSPALWNNVYKGALGEVVGKYYLERYLKMSLSDIDNPEIFELFDYKVEGSSIFIDFKNWSEGITEDRNVMLNKICDKAKKCGSECKCVIVANIIENKEWKFSDVVKDNIRIITLPCLVRNENGDLSFNKEAQDILRRSFNEYKN